LSYSIHNPYFTPEEQCVFRSNLSVRTDGAGQGHRDWVSGDLDASDFLYDAFTFARQYGPEVKLEYNDFNVFQSDGKAKAIIAMATLAMQRSLTLKELATSIEVALMSGGLIILITAAGGAFGSLLTAAGVGDAIQAMFAGGGEDTGGSPGSIRLMVLFLGFGVAAVLKIAQGSSTVAMITSAGMLASLAVPETLGFDPVYLAAAIGSGSLIGSWMNDSGFWIFAKMSGLTEVEALKTWTPLLLILGGVSFAMTLVLALVMPLV
jgi:H+/gluconate symporter-like permease